MAAPAGEIIQSATLIKCRLTGARIRKVEAGDEVYEAFREWLPRWTPRKPETHGAITITADLAAFRLSTLMPAYSIVRILPGIAIARLAYIVSEEIKTLALIFRGSRIA